MYQQSLKAKFDNWANHLFTTKILLAFNFHYFNFHTTIVYFFIVDMAGNFVILKSNATSFQNINSISNIQFRAWAQFLNENSLIRYALTTRVILNVEALRELYVTAEDTSDMNQKSFTFMIHERSITVTEHDLNRILQFPTDNFAPDPRMRK